MGAQISISVTNAHPHAQATVVEKDQDGKTVAYYPLKSMMAFTGVVSKEKSFEVVDWIELEELTKLVSPPEKKEEEEFESSGEEIRAVYKVEFRGSKPKTV